MEFPQYRRYTNGKSYFEISSAEEFTEYQVQFGTLIKSHFKANILPDRNYISDMLYDYHAHWEEIDRQEFQRFIEKNANSSSDKKA